MPREPDAGARGGWGPAQREIRWSYGTFQVDVRGPAATISWLAEFFEPAFERRVDSRGASVGDEAAGTRWAVDLVEDAEELAALRGRVAGADARLLDAFTLDGSFTQLPTWSESATRRLVLEPEAGAVFVVDASERRVRIVSSRREGGIDERVRLASMRVLRELATVSMLERTALPLHAAAFGTGEGVFAVCGTKRSGKSSLLVHALSWGATYIANDRAFLEPGQVGFLRGMPTLVMLRDGTLDLFPRLRAAYEDRAFDRARTVTECAPGIERPRPVAGAGHDHPGLTPTQFCVLTRATARPGGPLVAFLFPTLDKSARGLSLEPMRAREAAPLLEASLLLGGSPPRLSTVFASGKVDDDPPAASAELSTRLSEACGAALQRLPAFRCRLGPDAYESDPRKTFAGIWPLTEEGRPPRPDLRTTDR